MKKLSREQEKIIYITGVAIIFLILFIIFVYSPQKRKLSDIKKKLSYAESEIAEINRITQGKPLEQAVSGLNLQLKNLTAQLPFRIEDVVKSLSDAARQFKVDVKNIAFSAEQKYSGKIPGYIVKELPISMKLSSEYKNLGEYLHKLRTDFPVFIRVKQLAIEGSGEGVPELSVSLQVSAYLSESQQ
ncbi:MAG: type 4a pilus biogenesis protein PilO [Candidatus Omnitrophota bacterium]|mgnify:CR=1 FL=1